MSLASQVDLERLYQTTLALEGVRHPIDAPDALDAAADNIHRWMRDAGLTVHEQVFHIDGWGRPFRNIEGRLGPVGERSAVVLMAHYDTVATSPGANDNAAAVAVMLEAGRVLATLDDPPPVYFVAPSLEESSNPRVFGREKASALKHGVYDLGYRYPNWACAKYHPAIRKRALKLYETGLSQGDGFRQALDEFGDAVPANLRAHIEEIIPIYQPVRLTTSIGLRSRIGSHRWVQQALAEGKPIACNITIDEPGLFYDHPYSQGKYGPLDFDLFTDSYRLDAKNRVANFIAIATLTSSQHIGELYAEYCTRPDIDLPYGWVNAPLDFDGVVKHMPMGLASDHAPFWQAGIPAMLLFDTATGRDPFNHTVADTTEKLDFDRIADVTGALVETLADPRLLAWRARSP